MASTSRAVPSRPTKPGPAPTGPARAAAASAAAGTDRFWGHVLPVRVPGLIAFIRNQGRMPRKGSPPFFIFGRGFLLFPFKNRYNGFIKERNRVLYLYS